MLDWFFGKVNKMSDTAKRTQLYVRDDGRFCFRKLKVYKIALVIKKADRIIDAWLHRYNNQFAFPGFNNIPGDMVTISTQRDILYDPFNVVSNADKPDPEKNGVASQDYITQVFDASVREAQKQKPKGLMGDKLTYAGIAVIVLFAVGIFITWVS